MKLKIVRYDKHKNHSCINSLQTFEQILIFAQKYYFKKMWVTKWVIKINPPAQNQ